MINSEFTAFPYAHWRQVWSTNPLERVNKEIKRRTDVVGTFPTPGALLRLAGHVLIEKHDEWDGADRRYFSEHPMKLLDVTEEEVAIPALAAAQSQQLNSHGVQKLHHSGGRHKVHLPYGGLPRWSARLSEPSPSRRGGECNFSPGFHNDSRLLATAQQQSLASQPRTGHSTLLPCPRNRPPWRDARPVCIRSRAGNTRPPDPRARHGHGSAK